MAQEGRTNRFVQLADGLVVVPNAAADLCTKDAWVEQIVITNVAATATTISVKDKQGTPLSLLDTYSLATKTTVVFSFPRPVKMKGGINWVASAASALHAEVKGYRLAG